MRGKPLPNTSRVHSPPSQHVCDGDVQQDACRGRVEDSPEKQPNLRLWINRAADPQPQGPPQRQHQAKHNHCSEREYKQGRVVRCSGIYIFFRKGVGSSPENAFQPKFPRSRVLEIAAAIAMPSNACIVPKDPSWKHTH